MEDNKYYRVRAKKSDSFFDENIELIVFIGNRRSFVMKELKFEFDPLGKGDRADEQHITKIETELARELHASLGEALGIPKQSYLDGLVEAKKEHIRDLQVVMERLVK